MNGGAKGSAGIKAPLKIKAYPFEATIELDGVKKPIDIAVVTPKGFVANLRGVFFKVGDYYQAHGRISL